MGVGECVEWVCVWWCDCEFDVLFVDVECVIVGYCEWW